MCLVTHDCGELNQNEILVIQLIFIDPAVGAIRLTTHWDHTSLLTSISEIIKSLPESLTLARPSGKLLETLQANQS